MRGIRSGSGTVVGRFQKSREAVRRNLPWSPAAPWIGEAGLREVAVRVSARPCGPGATQVRDPPQWCRPSAACKSMPTQCVSSSLRGHTVLHFAPPPASVATCPPSGPLNVIVRRRWFHASATYSVTPSALASTSAREAWGDPECTWAPCAPRCCHLSLLVARRGRRKRQQGVATLRFINAPAGYWKVDRIRGPSACPVAPVPGRTVANEAFQLSPAKRAAG